MKNSMGINMTTHPKPNAKPRFGWMCLAVVAFALIFCGAGYARELAAAQDLHPEYQEASPKDKLFFSCPDDVFEIRVMPDPSKASPTMVNEKGELFLAQSPLRNKDAFKDHPPTGYLPHIRKKRPGGSDKPSEGKPSVTRLDITLEELLLKIDRIIPRTKEYYESFGFPLTWEIEKPKLGDPMWDGYAENVVLRDGTTLAGVIAKIPIVSGYDPGYRLLLHFGPPFPEYAHIERLLGEGDKVLTAPDGNLLSRTAVRKDSPPIEVLVIMLYERIYFIHQERIKR